MIRRFITQQHAQPVQRGQYCRILLFLSTMLLVLGACSPGDAYEEVSLPTTPVVALRPTWALIRVPYLRLYEQRDVSSPIAGHLRMGDIAEVVAIGTRVLRVDGRPQRWYLLNSGQAQGWTTGTALELFTSQERARNAASSAEGAP